MTFKHRENVKRTSINLIFDLSVFVTHMISTLVEQNKMLQSM